MSKGNKFLSTNKTESAIEQVDNVGEVELSNGVQLEEEVGGSKGLGKWGQNNQDRPNDAVQRVYEVLGTQCRQ